MSNERLMPEGLVHAYPGIKDYKFFEEIDKRGGWPLGWEYVGFEHSTERAAGFTHLPEHHGWWTTLYSADDYYTWKLSDKRLQQIGDQAVSEFLGNIRWATAPTSFKGHIKSFRDWPLTRRAEEKK